MHDFKQLFLVYRLGGKRGHAGLRTALRTADSGHANKKIPYVSAVENADTLICVSAVRCPQCCPQSACPRFPPNLVYLPCTDYTLKRVMLSNTHNCSTYSTHKVYHQSVKLIVILCGIVLFLSDFLVAASSFQCDSSNFER